MTPEQLSDLALDLPETTEDEAFGPGAAVFKVEAKVFAILEHASGGTPAQVTLKCEPDLALELREQYPAVGPGYHVNKRHWNTVVLNGTVPGDEIREMVEHSYDRVISGLPKAVRDRLRLLRAA
ncbi:MmcQ/YjbR family DNA-binding protein [Streptomyces gamaensis]|uniref:MmcQ/YjbR family DNA-binding protein n=1 Tax=Streptomyces gamaensis TaxID=1763542 RepID=A0ABW0ZET6_9ACTN